MQKKRLGIVIAILIVIVGATLLYPSYRGWRFEQEVKRQPLFQLIEKAHPKEFNVFLTKAKADLKEKGNTSAIPLYAAELMDRIFYRHLQYASDDLIFAYLQATINLYRYLNTQDPCAVIKLEDPKSNVSIDLNDLWKDKLFKALLNQLLEAKKKIIETTLTAAASPSNVGQTWIDQILSGLSQKFGEAVVKSLFSYASTSTDSAEKAASLIIDFYVGIAGMGKEKAGEAMRYMASVREKDHAQ